MTTKIFPKLIAVLLVGAALSACNSGGVVKSAKQVAHPMVGFSVPHIPGV